jgi:hypothetical protein
MKTGRKSIFHPRETHIIAWLDIMVLYTNFSCFEKYRVLTQNPSSVHGENVAKSIFHPHAAHILLWLDILMLYINLYGFLNMLSLSQNPNVLAFGFTENICSEQKLAKNLHFISVGPIFLLN